MLRIIQGPKIITTDDIIATKLGLTCELYSCKRDGGSQARRIRRYYGKLTYQPVNTSQPPITENVDVAIFDYKEFKLFFKWDKQYQVKKFVDGKHFSGCWIYGHGSQTDTWNGGHLNPFEPKKGPWEVYFNTPYGSVLSAKLFDEFEIIYTRTFSRWRRDVDKTTSIDILSRDTQFRSLERFAKAGLIRYDQIKTHKNLQKLVTGVSSNSNKLMNISLDPAESLDNFEQWRSCYSSLFDVISNTEGLCLLTGNPIFKQSFFLSEVFDFIHKYNLPRKVNVFCCRGGQISQTKNNNIIGSDDASWPSSYNEGFPLYESLGITDLKKHRTGEEQLRQMERIHNSINVKSVSETALQQQLAQGSEQIPVQRDTITKVRIARMLKENGKNYYDTYRQNSPYKHDPKWLNHMNMGNIDQKDTNSMDIPGKLQSNNISQRRIDSQKKLTSSRENLHTIDQTFAEHKQTRQPIMHSQFQGTSSVDGLTKYPLNYNQQKEVRYRIANLRKRLQQNNEYAFGEALNVEQAEIFSRKVAPAFKNRFETLFNMYLNSLTSLACDTNVNRWVTADYTYYIDLMDRMRTLSSAK